MCVWLWARVGACFAHIVVVLCFADTSRVFSQCGTHTFRVYSHCVNTTVIAVPAGNWGCGVFGGFIPLKCCLQWMAATAADRDMHYYVFTSGMVTHIHADTIPLGLSPQ